MDALTISVLSPNYIHSKGTSMPIRFKENLTIPPLPLRDIEAAILARQHAASIKAAGSVAEAARIAIDALIEPSSGTLISEHARLQRLYTQVYTRAELEHLMLSVFNSLELGDDHVI